MRSLRSRTHPSPASAAVTIAALCLALSAAAFADPIPVELPVTGAMLSPGGAPVADGSYAIAFRLYASDDAAAPALFVETFVSVLVEAGRFDVRLGTGANGATIPAQLFSDAGALWIGVTVGADPELPRKRLSTVPYAIRASLADQATTAAQAQVALAAQSIQCTGCITVDQLTDSALAAQNHSAIYGGQSSTVQTALSGLDSRLGDIETGVQVAGGVVTIGGTPAQNGQPPVCNVQIGSVCVDGVEAQLLLKVPNEAAMQQLQTPGAMVIRADTGQPWVNTPSGWRPLRFAPFCGDGFLDLAEGEQCDDGPNNANAPDACRLDCKNPTCGDGITDGGEACDDGNALDTDACVQGCKAATCGDGFVLAGVEPCDDGNNSDEDACLNGCVLNVCGDGKLNVGVEECDDGNQVDGDGCKADCTTEVSPIGCSDGSEDQTFSANMVACDGSYKKADYETACAKGWHPANPNEYFTYGGKTVSPNKIRWVDTAWDSSGKDTTLKNWQGWFDSSNGAGWNGLSKNSSCTWVSTSEQCYLTFANHDYGKSYGCHCRGGNPNTTGRGVICVKDSAALPRL